MKTRTDLINFLITRYRYKKYLEIGVGVGQNFNSIDIDTRHSVDPVYPSTFHMASDSFFNSVSKDEMYDIIFIDGDHSNGAVSRDIENALKHIVNGGVVLVHDISPAHQYAIQGSTTWFGDGFKEIIRLRATESKLFIRTIDFDCGISVIKHTNADQGLISVPGEVNYDFMDKDRSYSIGLISVKEFLMINLDMI